MRTDAFARYVIAVATAAAALVLHGCGGEEATGAKPVAVPAEVSKPAPAKRGEREEISAADEAEQRAQVLEPRDVPLQVGATTPSFEGYPAEKVRAVIVFFRGEW